MANVKSYAWAKRLDTPVEDTGTTDVMTPGFIDPTSYETDKTEFVLDGNVLTTAQASGVWAADFAKVTVTNSSGAAWHPGETLYVAVGGTPFDPANIQASFDALERRVTNLEGSVNAIETSVTTLGNRVSAVESSVSALDTRVTALETPVSATAAERIKPSATEPAPQLEEELEKHGEKHGKHSKKDK